MLTVDPFNVFPKAKYLGPTPWALNKINVDINAKVQVFESGGGIPRESIFILDIFKNQFIPLTIGVNWGTTDRIRIMVEIKYDIAILPQMGGNSDFAGSGTGTLFGFQEWIIQYPEQGLLLSKTKSSGGNGVIKSDGDIGIQVTNVPSESPQGFKGPFIVMDTNISISKSKSGLSIGIEYGPVSASKEVMSGSSSSRSVNYEFQVNLSVIGRPNVVTPPKPLEIPKDLLSHNVYFEKEGQKDMDAQELRRLEDWFKQIQSQSPKLYSVIKHGKCPIWISGYTSTTGKESHNKNLSKDRINSVEEALKTDLFQSKNVKINRIPQGEKKATQEGAVTRERRVEIRILQPDAIDAMK